MYAKLDAKDRSLWSSFFSSTLTIALTFSSKYAIRFEPGTEVDKEKRLQNRSKKEKAKQEEASKDGASEVASKETSTNEAAVASKETARKKGAVASKEAAGRKAAVAFLTGHGPPPEAASKEVESSSESEDDEAANESQEDKSGGGAKPAESADWSEKYEDYLLHLRHGVQHWPVEDADIPLVSHVAGHGGVQYKATGQHTETELYEETVVLPADKMITLQQLARAEYVAASRRVVVMAHITDQETAVNLEHLRDGAYGFMDPSSPGD